MLVRPMASPTRSTRWRRPEPRSANPIFPPLISRAPLVRCGYWSITARTWSPSGPGSSTGCAGISTSSTRRGIRRPVRSTATAASTTIAVAARRPSKGRSARIARDLVVRCRALTIDINDLEREIIALVVPLAPTLLALCGVGALTAAKIVGEVADVRRFRSKDAFARHNGTAPQPAWSGQQRPSPPLTHREPTAQRRAPPHRHHPRPLPP